MDGLGLIVSAGLTVLVALGCWIFHFPIEIAALITSIISAWLALTD